MADLTRTVLIIVLVATLLTGGTIFYFLFTYDISTVPLVATFGSKAGVSGDTDKVDFGVIPPKGTAVKKIRVTNEFSKNATVIMTPKGDIAPFLSLSINNFVLEPNETQEINLSVSRGEAEENAIHTGTLRVFLKRR